MQERRTLGADIPKHLEDEVTQEEEVHTGSNTSHNDECKLDTVREIIMGIDGTVKKKLYSL